MGKAVLWSCEKGRRGGGRAPLDGLGKMELIAVGVETDGRTVVRLRSPSPRRAVNHNIQRRRRAESRQRDRNEVFATIFSSGLENHLFQSTLLLWESAGAQRRGGLEPDRFPFLRPHLQSFRLRLTIKGVISLDRRREWTWDCLSNLLLHCFSFNVKEELPLKMHGNLWNDGSLISKTAAGDSFLTN